MSRRGWLSGVNASTCDVHPRPRVRTAGYKAGRRVPSGVQVECRFFGPFREDAGETRDRRETDAATVGALLRELEADYPSLAGRLVDGDGLAGSTVVTKAKTDVRHLSGLDTPLEEGDVIRLVPSVYGG